MNINRKFRYSVVSHDDGLSVLRPMLALTLESAEQDIQITALLDSCPDVTILPYSVGMALGINWYKQPVVDPPAGNLARYDARGLVTTAIIDGFEPVQLGFIWLRTDQVRPILGQFNLFMSFNVCFFRRDGLFELTLKK
jgi:hypothetical protein